jgi:hypothetical protein
MCKIKNRQGKCRSSIWDIVVEDGKKKSLTEAISHTVFYQWKYQVTALRSSVKSYSEVLLGNGIPIAHYPTHRNIFASKFTDVVNRA